MNKPQMKRLAVLNIAQSLEEAADDNLDALLALSVAYTVAKRAFTADELDPDPAVIAVGLQAQALGCKSLAQWLMAISEVAGIQYNNMGVALLDRVEREMDALGLIIPDTMIR